MGFATIHFGPFVCTCTLCGHREVNDARWWDDDYLCRNARACLERTRDLLKVPLDGGAPKGLPPCPARHRASHGLTVLT